jgi:hypothetical protein
VGVNISPAEQAGRVVLGVAATIAGVLLLTSARSVLAILVEFLPPASADFFAGAVLTLDLLATCVSGLFSSHRCINAFGLLAFVLAIAAYQVSTRTFISVWCFFAAVVSLLVYVHFSGPMQACRPQLTGSREQRAN